MSTVADVLIVGGGSAGASWRAASARIRIALSEVNDGHEALKDGSVNRVVVTSF